MRVPEQFITPALGVMVIVSAVFLGANSYFSLIYPILLGLLGLAAVGTYIVPPSVQVELRIVIAVVGILALVVMFNSLGFWLAFIGFGLIGALQIQHRGVLQRPLHTIEWLRTFRREPRTTVTATEAVGAAGATEVTKASMNRRSLPNINIGGIGASVLGAIVLLSFLFPWVTMYSEDSGLMDSVFSGFEDAEATSSTEHLNGYQFSRDLAVYAEEENLPRAYLGTVAGVVVAVLGAVSIGSFFLPRFVPIVLGIAGCIVTIVLMLGIRLVLFALESEYSEYIEMAEMMGYRSEVGLGFGIYVALLAFFGIAFLPIVAPKGDTAN